MAVDEEVGIVVVDARGFGRSLRISRDLGGTVVNQDGKVVKLPIRRDRDQGLSPATV